MFTFEVVWFIFNNYLEGLLTPLYLIIYKPIMIWTKVNYQLTRPIAHSSFLLYISRRHGIFWNFSHWTYCTLCWSGAFFRSKSQIKSPSQCKSLPWANEHEKRSNKKERQSAPAQGCRSVEIINGNILNSPIIPIYLDK